MMKKKFNFKKALPFIIILSILVLFEILWTCAVDIFIFCGDSSELEEVYKIGTFEITRRQFFDLSNYFNFFFCLCGAFYILLGWLLRKIVSCYER